MRKPQPPFTVRGLARIEDRWSGTGATGDRFRDPKHVYADDLDLFGRGCLFELLSTARMPMGENRLAEWLRSPSPAQVVVERLFWIGPENFTEAAEVPSTEEEAPFPD
jgi:hypothetical protein